MEAAAVEAGLSLAEFYSLTLRRWQFIFDRHVDAEIRHERRIGLLACLYANKHRDKEKHRKPFTVDDFAPAVRGAKPVDQSMTGSDLLMATQLAHLALTEKGAPKGAFGKLSQVELEALYLDRHRLYGKLN